MKRKIYRTSLAGVSKQTLELHDMMILVLHLELIIDRSFSHISLFTTDNKHEYNEMLNHIKLCKYENGSSKQFFGENLSFAKLPAYHSTHCWLNKNMNPIKQ